MFSDRRQAGRRLGRRLLPTQRENPVVVSMPGDALLVADEVADRLEAPLRLLLVRRLAPSDPASEHRRSAAPDADLALEAVELYRRKSRHRPWAPALAVVQRTAILVDDGTSGLPMIEAAVATIRADAPRRLVFAAPRRTPALEARIRGRVDELVCPDAEPEPGPDLYGAQDHVDASTVQQILRERAANALFPR
jgi:predicted phosphoribosyltransferase